MEDWLFDFYDRFAHRDLLSDLYLLEQLATLNIWCVIICAAGAGLYYWLIDHPAYSRPRHWWITSMLVFLTSVTWCVLRMIWLRSDEIPTSSADGGFMMDFDFATLLVFACWVAGITTIVFFMILFSALCQQFLSVNCRRNPYPFLPIR